MAWSSDDQGTVTPADWLYFTVFYSHLIFNTLNRIVNPFTRAFLLGGVSDMPTVQSARDLARNVDRMTVVF